MGKAHHGLQVRLSGVGIAQVQSHDRAHGDVVAHRHRTRLRVDAEDPANDVVGGMSPIDPVIARDPDVQSPHREGLIAVIERGHDIA